MFDRRRPDPQLGVFETLLIRDGRPVELDAHLARLEASLAELYPDRTPPLLGEMDVPARGRLRVTVAPGGDGELGVEVAVRGPESPVPAVGLHSLVLDGGLGAHKWADRSLLDEAQAHLPADALPLIVDRDGAVLEASRANLFVVRGGALLTPPADGRLLPGITRMRILELAGGLGLDAREAPLRRSDLLAADEVFLTGSIRGVEPAASLDGAPLGGAGEVAGRIASDLWRGWAGEKAAAAFG